MAAPRINENKVSKFMQEAEFKAQLWSKDPRAKVCALVIDPDGLHILSTGYNGIPRGVLENENRWARTCGEKYYWVEHAERNAIYNASRRGVALAGSVLICNKYPCADCVRAIIQCGIVEVHTRPLDVKNKKWAKSWECASIMFEESGVVVRQVALDL